MKATYSTRTARREDAARIAVLGAHVWVHTYAAAGVSDVIAQYVLTFYRARGMTQEGITHFDLGGVKHENKVMVARD